MISYEHEHYRMARIEGFLDQYAKPATRSSYRGGVYAFLSFLYGFERQGKRISDDEKNVAEALADKYFLEGRNHAQDLVAFNNHCEGKFAPTTASYYQTAVREFLVFNDVNITEKERRVLKKKIRRGGPISQEAAMNKETIRQLLNVCDLKMKTLILFIISSGARLGEVLDLNISDVKIREGSGVVSIRNSKNKFTRTTFINGESVEVLKQWLVQRDDYLKYIISKSRGRFRVKTPAQDHRLFPINKNSAEKNIKTALKKAGLMEKDRETGRTTIHFHGFRKYFVTQMSYSGVPDKYLEFFVGHINELDRAYNRPSIDQLFEQYQKGEPHLRIYDESAEEIAETKSQIKEATEAMRDIRLENLEVKQKLLEFERVQSRLKELEEQMSAISTLEKIQASLSPADLAEISRRVAEAMKK